MKSLTFAKIILVLYLCISQSAIECIQVSKTKKALKKKVTKVSAHLSKSQIKLYAKIASQFKHRDATMSKFPAVNAQMLKCWEVLKMPNTSQTEVDAELLKLDLLYTGEKKKLEDKQDNVDQQAIEKEQEEFYSHFNEGVIVDKMNEKAMKELAQQEAEEAKLTTKKMTAEEKESKIDQFSRSKFQIQNKILEGETHLIRIFTEFLTKNQVQDEVIFSQKIIKALENSLPAKFCYRKSGTLSKSQVKSCPSTHPVQTILDTCVETCAMGQKRKNIKMDSKFLKTAGVCWENCDRSKQPKCVKKVTIMYPTGVSWWTWHWQRSFIPSFKTVFSKSVECANGQEKWGFWCYDKTMTCPAIGYEKCGPAACAVDTVNCVKVISDMVLSTICGLAKFALLFVAPGVGNVLQAVVDIGGQIHKWSALILNMIASRNYMLQAYKNKILKERMILTATKYMMKHEYTKLGSATLTQDQIKARVITAFDIQMKVLTTDKAAETQDSIDSFVKGAGDAVKTTIIKDGVNAVLKEQIPKLLTKVGVDAMADGAFKSVLGQLKCFNYQTVTYVIGAIKACGPDGTGPSCAQNILGAVSQFDPTGLTGIARAFMYDTCDYTEDILDNDDE